jgi:DNA polymerase delta subunit 2
MSVHCAACCGSSCCGRDSRGGNGEGGIVPAQSIRPPPPPFQIGGVVFLGHSGQPVADVLRYSTDTFAMTNDRSLLLQKSSGEGATASPELDALTNTLLWRHMAPTAPDTLTCYPFYEVDP